jgi:hypothetical protein
MILDFTKDGTVESKMNKYIKEMLDGVPDDMNGKSPIPEANHLFQINETDLKSLDESIAMLFHQIVAMLLYLCKQAQSNIQTAVAFLCIWVKGLNEDTTKSCHK